MPSPELMRLRAERAALPRSDAPIDVAEMRAGLDALVALLPPPPPGVALDEVEVAGLRAERHTPTGAPDDAVVVAVHGGAYVAGRPAGHRALVAAVAHAAGVPLLSVDYTLAPEAPCPVAIGEVVGVVRSLVSDGIRPERLVLLGDSAGGGIALGALVRLRDEGGPALAGAALVCPWLDLTVSSASVTDNAERDVALDVAVLRQAAPLYCGSLDPADPIASPVFADLTGLPPLFVQVGLDEVLLDDSRTLARQARAAGVDVVLDEWEGGFHVWHTGVGTVPEADEAIARIGEFIAERVAVAR